MTTLLLDRPRGAITDPAEDAAWNAIVAALTRRELLTAAGAAGLAIGLASWGDETAAAAGAATRVINTAKGKVTVPANPQRIVCVETFSVYDLLDVGCTPVGMPTDDPAYLAPEYVKVYKSIAKVVTGNGGELNFEEIAALRPDLILGLTYESTPYDKLRAIAPTVLFKWGMTSGDWPRFAAQFADAVNRTKQLDALKHRYLSRAAAIRSTYAGILSKTRWGIAVGGDDGQFFLYFHDSSGGVVLADAGVQFARAAAGKTGTYEELSYEQISMLSDADVLLTDADDSGKPSAGTLQLMNQAGWRALKAVRNKHVYPLPRVAFSSSYGSGLDLLDEVEAILRKL